MTFSLQFWSINSCDLLFLLQVTIFLGYVSYFSRQIWGTSENVHRGHYWYADVGDAVTVTDVGDGLNNSIWWQLWDFENSRRLRHQHPLSNIINIERLHQKDFTNILIVTNIKTLSPISSRQHGRILWKLTYWTFVVSLRINRLLFKCLIWDDLFRLLDRWTPRICL